MHLHSELGDVRSGIRPEKKLCHCDLAKDGNLESEQRGTRLAQPSFQCARAYLET